jgi:type II secretory pathway pseudopilin PulG
MTDVLSREVFGAAFAVGLMIAVVLACLLIVQRTRERTAKAERRLAILYAAVEAAVGDQIDRSFGGNWHDQVALGLKRLASAIPALSEADRARGAGSVSNWLGSANQALDAAAKEVGMLPPGSESARVTTTLRLAGRIQQTLQDLSTIDSPADLENALSAGLLNDLMTTAPLLSAYFGGDPSLATVVEGYLCAAAALKLALLERAISVDVPAIFSIVPRSEAHGDTVDGRELRHIPAARAHANRMADRLMPGESLVVYCSVPGWTGRDGKRPPSLVFWNRASWLV